MNGLNPGNVKKSKSLELFEISGLIWEDEVKNVEIHVPTFFK